jgi:DNA polymerase I-like protein with 3'-5' exonuclease and polymerase domains
LEDASTKFFSNYILEFERNGRVHPNIHQFRSEGGGTRSHRFSYSAPPLQQAPARNGEFASVFRSVFLPEKGEVWAAIDYSQQEFRLFVHYSELLKLSKAKEAGDKYREDPNTDFHTMVSELTGLNRKQAKNVNFAAAYGAGVAQLAVMSGMTLEEATQVRKQYDERMPFIKQLGDFCNKRAAQTGKIRMIDGAVSHFDQYECAEYGVMGIASTWEEAQKRTRKEGDEWFGKSLRRAYTNKACNRLVQGSAARQTKKAMIDCYRAGILPLLTLHDELDFSVKSKEEAELAARLMVDAIKFTIPMKCDVEYGNSWGDSMSGRSWDDVVGNG